MDCTAAYREALTGAFSVTASSAPAPGQRQVTPYEGGRVMAGLLGDRLITVADEGFHESYAVRGNRAVDDSVNAYVADGVLPSADVSYPGTPRPDVPAERAGEAGSGRPGAAG